MLWNVQLSDLPLGGLLIDVKQNNIILDILIYEPPPKILVYRRGCLFAAEKNYLLADLSHVTVNYNQIIV